MTPLHPPVKRVLRKTTTPKSVARMWNRIDARTRTKPRSARARARMVAVAALAVAVLEVVLWQRRSAVPLRDVERRLDEPGALALRAERADDVERVVSLSDRSTITLAPGAAVEPIESSPTALVLRQLRGGVLYAVEPGGPRRWTIECGLVTVEVVGTKFRIDRAATRARVEVEHGIVVVRGGRVAGGVVRLTEGMSVEVAAEGDAVLASPSARATAAGLAPRAPLPSATSGAPLAKGSTWRRLAARGENDAAYAELGPGGVARVAESASVEDLLALADVARLSGHPSEAVEPLERILREHPSDGRASIAAFTLGRVQLRSLGAPAPAARAFERAISLGIPGGLAEDAYALWIESLGRSGDDAGAMAAHARFTARFPGSARRDELQKWLRAP